MVYPLALVKFRSFHYLCFNSQEMCPLEILVLYENDGLFSKYSDGTTLQLSPCGAAFLHRETPPNLCEVQRLTRFATSSFKRKIVQSIQIRNLFAARPYLCKELTNPQELQVYILQVYEYPAI